SDRLELGPTEGPNNAGVSPLRVTSRRQSLLGTRRLCLGKQTSALSKVQKFNLIERARSDRGWALKPIHEARSQPATILLWATIEIQRQSGRTRAWTSTSALTPLGRTTPKLPEPSASHPGGTRGRADARCLSGRPPTLASRRPPCGARISGRGS